MKDLSKVVKEQLLECGLSDRDFSVSVESRTYRENGQEFKEYGWCKIGIHCGFSGIPRILLCVNHLKEYFEVTLVVKESAIVWIDIQHVNADAVGLRISTIG